MHSCFLRLLLRWACCAGEEARELQQKASSPRVVRVSGLGFRA